MHHSWLKSGSLEGVLEPVLPMGDVVQTCPLNTRDEIDPDVFNSMTSLGCFRDKHKLIDSLLSPRSGMICDCLLYSSVMAVYFYVVMDGLVLLSFYDYLQCVVIIAA